MKWFWKRIQDEPVGFQALIQTGAALGIAFGFDISNEALGAILAFTASLLSFLTRTQVTPLSNPRTNEGVTLIEKP